MRLIDADVLFNAVDKSRRHNTHEKDEFRRAHEYEHSHFVNLIVEQETIDAVPVVRCRKCRFNTTEKKCLNPDSIIKIPGDNDFCSYGERREDGGE